MRVQNWPTLLHAFVESRRNLPFNWETNNCGFLACDWVLILTGIDPAADYRGKTTLGLRRMLKKRDLTAIASALAAANQWPQCPAAFVQRGDVVELGMPKEQAPGVALGVCIGRESIFPGPSALVFVATSTCQLGWKIN